MTGQHLIHIHLVDVIAAEHADVVRLLVEDELQVLVDGVGRPPEPDRALSHLGRNDVDVLPISGTRRQVRVMCSMSEFDLNWVRTLILKKPELMKLLMTKSMIR